VLLVICLDQPRQYSASRRRQLTVRAMMLVIGSEVAIFSEGENYIDDRSVARAWRARADESLPVRASPKETLPHSNSVLDATPTHSLTPVEKRALCPVHLRPVASASRRLLWLSGLKAGSWTEGAAALALAIEAVGYFLGRFQVNPVYPPLVKYSGMAQPPAGSIGRPLA
jgi:hypothetical protein